MKEKKFIGSWSGRQELLKEQYASKAMVGEHELASVNIYTVKSRFGIRVELLDWKYNWDKIWTTTLSKAERIKQEKHIKKVEAEYAARKAKGLPEVDTSKWVKPDAETFKHRLIESFVVMELLKEETDEWKKEHAIAGILYSIIHSHAPNNPQMLMNYAIDIGDPLEHALALVGNKYSGHSFKLMDNKKCMIKGKFNHDKYSYEITKWREELKTGIIKPMYMLRPNKDMRKYRQKMYEYVKNLKPDEEDIKVVKARIKKQEVEHKKHVAKIERIKDKAIKKYGFKPAWK